MYVLKEGRWGHGHPVRGLPALHKQNFCWVKFDIWAENLVIVMLDICQKLHIPSYDRQNFSDDQLPSETSAATVSSGTGYTGDWPLIVGC